MTLHTCAITGTESPGKHYMIKTTDGGEEAISPEALFHPQADRDMGRILLDLARRLDAVEKALAPAESGDRVQQAAEEAAAPVKKAPAAKAAGKKLPGQRKAVD